MNDLNINNDNLLAPENVVEEINEDELFVPVQLDEKESERIAAEPYSYWKSVFRIFLKKPSAMIALVSLILFITCSLSSLLYPIIPEPDEATVSEFGLIIPTILISSAFLK